MEDSRSVQEFQILWGGGNVELVASLLVATLLPNTGHMVDYPRF